MGLVSNCLNSRTCLKIRRSDSVQRGIRRMDKAPNGIWSSFPAVWAVLAWALSLGSSCVCAFLLRSVNFKGEEANLPKGNSALLTRDQGIGFWGWEAEGSCYSYTINGQTPSFDSSFSAASAFTTVSNVLGGIVMVCLLLGTVFPVMPRSYEKLGYLALLTAILDGCTLMVLGSNVCSPGFFNYAFDQAEQDKIDLTQITDTSCGLGLGASLSVTAAVFWLITAFGCLRTPLASRKREPNPYRGYTKDGVGQPHAEMHGDKNDEAHQLYRQRQAENEQKYREMFGEVDSVDEEVTPGFKSLKQPKLSFVQESEEDDVTRDSGHQNGRRPSLEEYQDEYDDQDEPSETRSQYSEEQAAHTPMQASDDALDGDDDDFDDVEDAVASRDGHSSRSSGIHSGSDSGSRQQGSEMKSLGEGSELV